MASFARENIRLFDRRQGASTPLSPGEIREEGQGGHGLSDLDGRIPGPRTGHGGDAAPSAVLLEAYVVASVLHANADTLHVLQATIAGFVKVLIQVCWSRSEFSTLSFNQWT